MASIGGWNFPSHYFSETVYTQDRRAKSIMSANPIARGIRHSGVLLMQCCLPTSWLRMQIHRSLPLQQDLQLLDGGLSFASAGTSVAAVLIIGLVTLTAAYYYIKICSSWKNAFLLHLQACRTRPYHWLGHAHRSLPLHRIFSSWMDGFLLRLQARRT